MTLNMTCTSFLAEHTALEFSSRDLGLCASLPESSDPWLSPTLTFILLTTKHKLLAEESPG